MGSSRDKALNLNRMTTSPPLVSGGSLSAWTYEHDILGNRTRRNASTNNHAHPMRYDWDVLNRATLIAQPSGGAGYAYRADGQRIEKVEGITFSWSGSRESGQYDTNYAQNRPTSRYYYDGQMGFEDDYNPSGTVTQVNRYILGARGIDRIARTESGNTTLAYPMYDGHGNMRALLTRDGTGYDTGNWKTYDVWGSVRSGGSSADPKQGYVASIGHVSDSESSLIYMRARFYEPATGRFLSEDPAGDGLNWYVYCVNSPVNRVDFDGRVSLPLGVALLIGFTVFLGAHSIIDYARHGHVHPGATLSKAAVDGVLVEILRLSEPALFKAARTAWFAYETSKAARYTAAGIAITVMFLYTMLIIAALVFINDSVDQLFYGP